MVSTAVELLDTSEDTNGCSVSPDNNGCVMNRPIDEQRRAATLGFVEDELDVIEDSNNLEDELYVVEDSNNLEDELDVVEDGNNLEDDILNEYDDNTAGEYDILAEPILESDRGI